MISLLVLIGLIVLATGVEVLQLLEILSFLDDWSDCRWVLPIAIPAAGCITDAIVGIGIPFFGFLRNIQHFEDADQIVLGGICLLEQLRMCTHTSLLIVAMQLVEQR